MKKPSITLLTAICAGLLAISSPVTGQDTGNKDKASAASAATMDAKVDKDKKSAAGNADPMVSAVLVVLPVAQASGDKLGNGCWVRFYDNRNYLGSNLTLVGPVDMPDMTVPGAAWRDWDSVMVGPKARVTTYDNSGYRDRTATLMSGQHIPDLHDKKLGWFDEIHSARVTCTTS